MELALQCGISAIKPFIDIFELFSDSIVPPFKGDLKRFLGLHAGRDRQVCWVKRE